MPSVYVTLDFTDIQVEKLEVKNEHFLHDNYFTMQINSSNILLPEAELRELIEKAAMALDEPAKIKKDRLTA